MEETTLNQQYTEYEDRLSLQSETPILGMLAWYSVPEAVEIKHGEFLQLVEDNDAPIVLPNVPKPANVFRRACNKAKMLKVPSSNPDRFYNYTMRNAGYDENFVFRRLVEEEVDTDDHKLGFRDIGLAIFSKKEFSVFYQLEIDEHDPAVDYWNKITRTVDDFLATNKLSLPAIAIREAARRGLVDKLLATPVRESGGVYFVASCHREKLEALDKTVNSVDTCHFHVLPLIDDVRQRTMLKTAFEDETTAKTVALVADINELLAQGAAVPAKTFITIQQKYADLQNRLHEYQIVLSDSLSRTEAALEVANKQVLALLENSTT